MATYYKTASGNVYDSISLAQAFQGKIPPPVTRRLLGIKKISKKEFEAKKGQNKKALKTRKNPKEGDVEYTLVPMHIDLVQPGDAIFHDGKLRTLTKSNIKRGGMGKTIWGDSYKSGYEMVMVADIKHAKPARKNPMSKTPLYEVVITFPRGSGVADRSDTIRTSKGIADARKVIAAKWGIKVSNRNATLGRDTHRGISASIKASRIGSSKKNPTSRKGSLTYARQVVKNKIRQGAAGPFIIGSYFMGGMPRYEVQVGLKWAKTSMTPSGVHAWIPEEMWYGEVKKSGDGLKATKVQKKLR